MQALDFFRRLEEEEQVMNLKVFLNLPSGVSPYGSAQTLEGNRRMEKGQHQEDHRMCQLEEVGLITLVVYAKHRRSLGSE